MKKLFGILSMSLIALSLVLVSCSKEEEWLDADNFVIKTYTEMREGPLGGHFKCYKAVFPISISFPDESSHLSFFQVDFDNSLQQRSFQSQA